MQEPMNTATSPAASSPEALERTLWTGTPSQWINFPQYVLWLSVFVVLIALGVMMWESMQVTLPAAMLWALVIAAFIPLFVIAWKCAIVATTQYELTTERLRTRWGVFNKHLDELELYRVRDYRLQQPFFLRLVSLANITLQTSDRSHATFTLRAISSAESVREQMRTHVEEARRRRGVRELDIE